MCFVSSASNSRMASLSESCPGHRPQTVPPTRCGQGTNVEPASCRCTTSEADSGCLLLSSIRNGAQPCNHRYSRFHLSQFLSVREKFPPANETTHPITAGTVGACIDDAHASIAWEARRAILMCPVLHNLVDWYCHRAPKELGRPRSEPPRQCISSRRTGPREPPRWTGLPTL